MAATFVSVEQIQNSPSDALKHLKYFWTVLENKILMFWTSSLKIFKILRSYLQSLCNLNIKYSVATRCKVRSGVTKPLAGFAVPQEGCTDPNRPSPCLSQVCLRSRQANCLQASSHLAQHRTPLTCTGCVCFHWQERGWHCPVLTMKDRGQSFPPGFCWALSHSYPGQ